MNKNLTAWSDDILQYLLEFKQHNPDFTFSLRQRDSAQSADVTRLQNGQWFQGSFYIYVPLFKKGDSARKIKTIGFVVNFEDDEIDSNYIEISFKAGDFGDAENRFHRELAEKIDLKLNDTNHGTKGFPEGKTIFENLFYFITEFRNLAIELLHRYNIYDKYNISEEQFKKDLTKILTIRSTLHKTKQMLNPIVDLLQYKKQIILQGPPGTGKTREAKILAQLLTNSTNGSQSQLTKNYIIKNLQVGQIIKGNYKNSYRISKISNDTVYVINDYKNEYSTSFEKILSKVTLKQYDHNPGGEVIPNAIAAYIDAKWEAEKNVDSRNIKLIQFHPSYTYEDFVRGIVAKPSLEGEGIAYEAENKTLAEFAEEALKNYNDSQPVHDYVKTGEKQTKSELDQFVSHVIEAIDLDGKYSISDNVYIFYVDDKRFKYKGDNWEKHAKGLNMNFSELKKIIERDISERSDIVKEPTLNALTRSHATYYANIIEKYKEFTATKRIHLSTTSQTIKNYILIIDEINRANLSSVFGELIYALEYRNKKVDSMYAVDGDTKLILPPNLYIIGTMNTADRSVGHIDYAIRRRFAFVDVLPKDLSEDKSIKFHSQLFKEISALFIKNFDAYSTDNTIALEKAEALSAEFRPEDVWLGHSYFIQKRTEAGTLIPEDFSIRLEYEIKPILLEYVKDGVLIDPTGTDKIEKRIRDLKVLD